MTEMIQKAKYYKEHLKVLCALAGILIAGGLLGATLVAAYYREVLAQERVVNRGMFVALGKRLDDISHQLEGTATVQAATATKLQDATSNFSDAAEKVDLAADKASKAAKVASSHATKAAKAPVPQPAVVQPEVVNREIRRANERLKERGS